MRVVGKDVGVGRIRRAHGGDVPGLARVHVASWHASYGDIIPAEEIRRQTSTARSTSRFARELSSSARTNVTHVLEDGSGVFGYATMGRQTNPRLPFPGEVFELYVHPERWGEGAGRQLLTHAIWTLVEHRLNPVMLWALTENTRGRRFYEACGGRPVARAPIEFGDKVTTKIAYAWDRVLPMPSF